MKHLFFIIFCVMISVTSFAQSQNTESEETTSSSDDSEFVYETADVMPSFRGGQKALTEYLVKNTKYPQAAMKAGQQGKVLCSFIVETDGTISDLKVVKKIWPLLEVEAKRVVSNMPKWIPAMNDEIPVRCRITLPVVFRIKK